MMEIYKEMGVSMLLGWESKLVLFQIIYNVNFASVDLS